MVATLYTLVLVPFPALNPPVRDIYHRNVFRSEDYAAYLYGIVWLARNFGKGINERKSFHSGDLLLFLVSEH